MLEGLNPAWPTARLRDSSASSAAGRLPVTLSPVGSTVAVSSGRWRGTTSEGEPQGVTLRTGPLTRTAIREEAQRRMSPLPVP